MPLVAEGVAALDAMESGPMLAEVVRLGGVEVMGLSLRLEWLLELESLPLL